MAGPDPNRSTAICSEADIARRTVSARRWLGVEGSCEFFGLGHRRAAGEVLADVGRRTSLDGGTLAQQLRTVASLRSAGEDHVRAMGGANHSGQLAERPGVAGTVRRRDQS